MKKAQVHLSDEVPDRRKWSSCGLGGISLIIIAGVNQMSGMECKERLGQGKSYCGDYLTTPEERLTEKQVRFEEDRNTATI